MVIKTDKGNGNDAARRQEGLHWFPDADAINRIVSAVTSTPRGKKKLATNYNRDQLVKDLLEAWTKWLVVLPLDSDTGARNRRKLFSAIVRTGKYFKKRLLDDTGQKYAARQIASTFSNASDFYAFLGGLNRTIEAAEILARQNSHGGLVRLTRAPKEWFAIEILLPVYECNFCRNGGISRPGSSKAIAGAADGPFPRFVVAVMREMGMAISPETVARALKDVRAGAPRRKPRKTTLQRPHGW